jgi:asparagine synthetase B (glutamine-hydrolysing)
MEASKLKELYIETNISKELRMLIRQVVEKKDAKGLLLGGTDSAIIAWPTPEIHARTVVMNDEGGDRIHSKRVAKALNLKNWESVIITPENAMDKLKLLVRINKSYDLGMVNDIAPYVAIDNLAKTGVKFIRSGQDPELLFQGYEYLADMNTNKFQAYLSTWPLRPRLPLDTLEKHFGIEIHYPYLDPLIREFAIKLKREDNVVDNTNAYGSAAQEIYRFPPRYTKLTLRRTMVNILPLELAFRPMADLKYGTGTYKLEEALKIISGPETISEINAKGPPFFGNKAHHGLFVLYKDAGLRPQPRTG